MCAQPRGWAQIFPGFGARPRNRSNREQVIVLGTRYVAYGRGAFPGPAPTVPAGAHGVLFRGSVRAALSPNTGARNVGRGVDGPAPLVTGGLSMSLVGPPLPPLHP